MKNIYRFLIGTLLALVFVVVLPLLALILLVAAIPFIVIGGALFTVLAIVFIIVGIFAFIWYLSREEKHKKKRSKSYSISQGRAV